MTGGFGFIWDMMDKMKENLSRLPSKQPKFKLGSKFMEGRIPEKTRQNRKLKVKEISESELAEVISKIRLDMQEERRRQQFLLPLIILIVILILIVIFILFCQLLEWYLSGGKEYLRGR